MRSGFSVLINNKGIKASNDSEKAECLNDFFSTFTCEDTSSIPSLPHKTVNKKTSYISSYICPGSQINEQVKNRQVPWPRSHTQQSAL